MPEKNTKYVILLCDGMADRPVPELSGRTPMEAAHKPNMDALAAKSETGLVKTVPNGMKPGSDVANLSVMGYDPAVYYTGRSPLEAASIGIDLKDDDVTLRCNLVTLSDGENYGEKTIIDYCAGDIPTAQADILIKDLQKALGGEEFTFYTGTAYRHCLVWRGGDADIGDLTQPHDITGKVIGPYLGCYQNAPKILELMQKSYEILKDHPVNKERIKNGESPANSVWLWGQGKKPALTPFYGLYGLRGSVISAVDLLRGIGKCAGMSVVAVDGATGYIDTNFEGKAGAALSELARGQDFVYIHIEAPDECGHRGETEKKVLAIELIDGRALAPLLKGLREYESYRLLILPDHATPLELRTHSAEPVPYILYDSRDIKPGKPGFDEASAKKTGILINSGPELIKRFIGEPTPHLF